MSGVQTALDLRAKRANLATQMAEILKAPKGENGQLDSEQRTTFDRITADVDNMKGDIDRLEKHEAFERELNASTGRRTSEDTTTTRSDKGADKAARAAAFEKYMRYGAQSMSGEERALLRPGQVEGRALGTNVDSAGGYLVEDEAARPIIEAQLAFGGMREARTTKLTTVTGADLPIPTSDDTSNAGVLVGENNALTEQGITFGQKWLRSYTWSSKIVKVSRQLLQDSAFDVAGFVGRKLGERIGRIQNTKFTLGTGDSMPYGLAATSTEGKAGATGQATSVIYNDLVDLVHSVPRAYRMGSEFMFADATLGILRKLKDGNGLPIWQPGVVGGAPDQILGYKYVINDDVAAMAASAKSIYFGDFSTYWIRDVQGVVLLRLEELYAANLQVGFVAFARADGNLVNGGIAAIKHYTNSAS